MNMELDALKQEYAGLRNWLTESALPLWSTTGVDRVHGGFYEKIDHKGTAVDLPRRARLNARQVYVFSTVPGIGWDGPADDLVEHGLEFLKTRYIQPDYSVLSVVHSHGHVIEPKFDLYDYAFVLFALAAAAQRRGGDGELAAIGRAIRETMKAGWKHPVAGFEESKPRTLPLKANPHMHTFEASLAWVETPQGDVDGAWERLADEIAELCLAKFLTSDGKLLEFFDGDWQPHPTDEGLIVEPGHQYEWAWLLIRWGRRKGRADAIAAARRLVDVAETHGTDAARGVAFNEIWTDTSIKDHNARLWPQTERIKAWIAMAESADSEAEAAGAIAKAAVAVAGLKKFLVTDVAGLWHETMAPDGTFIIEDPRGSSLYHIVCAMSEVERYLSRD